MVIESGLNLIQAILGQDKKKIGKIVWLLKAEYTDYLCIYIPLHLLIRTTHWLINIWSVIIRINTEGNLWLWNPAICQISGFILSVNPNYSWWKFKRCPCFVLTHTTGIYVYSTVNYIICLLHSRFICLKYW